MEEKETLEQFRSKFGKNKFLLSDLVSFKKGDWVRQKDLEQFLLTACKESYERGKKEMIEKIKSFQMQIDMDSPSGRKTISVIPIVAIENEIESKLEQSLKI